MKVHNNKSSGGESFADMLAATDAESGETAQTQTGQAVKTAGEQAAPAPQDQDDQPPAMMAQAPDEMLATLPAFKPQTAAGKDDSEAKPDAAQDGPDQPANDNDNDAAAQASIMPAAAPAPQPIAAAPHAPTEGDAATGMIADAPAKPQAALPQQADDGNEKTDGAQTAATRGQDGQATAKPGAKPVRAAAAKAEPDQAESRPAPQAGNDANAPVKPAEVAPQQAAANQNSMPQPDTLPVSGPGQAGAHAAQQAAANTAAPDTAKPAPHAAPDLDKLAVQISSRSGAGAKQFDIRLDPPELGRVEVRLSIDSSGKAQAHLTAEQPQTLDLLQKDAPVLTRALREAGLDVAQDGLNFSLRQQQHQAGQEQHAPGRAIRGGFAAPASIQPAMAAAASRGSAIGLLDIRV